MDAKQAKPRQSRLRVNPTSPGPLAMPHERDETPGDGVAAAPQPAVEQAARDLGRGLVDTDNYTRAREVTKPPQAGRPRKRLP